MAEATGAENLGERSADKSTGSASNTSNNNGAGDERRFTQDDVNRLLADHKRELRKENETLRGEVTQANEKLSSLTEKMAGYDEFMTRYTEEHEQPDRDAGDDDLSQFQYELQHPPAWVRTEKDRDRYAKMLEREYGDRARIGSLTGTLTELQKRLDEESKQRELERKARESLELSRRESDRNALLAGIAAEQNAIDVQAVQRIFREDLVWDDPSGRWLYKAEDGQLADPRRAIRLPDYLKKPATTNGGSGSGGQRGTPLSPLAELEAKEAELKALKERAEATGNQADVHRFLVAQRAVSTLRETATRKAA